MSTGILSDYLKRESSLEEKEKDNVDYLRKTNNFSKNLNKSAIFTFNNNRKKVFQIHSTSCNLNININNTNFNPNNPHNMTTTTSINSTSNHNNINLNISSENTKKRGRKKFLIEGVKTEIVDKAFLREFRCFVKKHKYFINIYEDLRFEEKAFWNEFLKNNSPPFNFGNDLIFKSYNKNFMKYLFSFNSVKNLYDQFVKEKGSELLNSIIRKKTKTVDRKMMLFYNYYGMNMHRLYSSDSSVNELIYAYEDMNNTSLGQNINMTNISDCLNLNYSII